MSEDTKFATGAVRSGDANATRFDLIHPVAMIRLAETYAEGALKYGGENWEQGMPAHDLLNHAIRHIYMFLSGDRTEPHLPHAAWGVMSAIASVELWPELNEGHLRSPGCVLGPKILERLEEFKRRKAELQAKGEWPEIGAQDSGDVDRIVEQRCDELMEQHARAIVAAGRRCGKIEATRAATDRVVRAGQAIGKAFESIPVEAEESESAFSQDNDGQWLLNERLSARQFAGSIRKATPIDGDPFLDYAKGDDKLAALLKAQSDAELALDQANDATLSYIGSKPYAAVTSDERREFQRIKESLH